jgi:hypothetical protein
MKKETIYSVVDTSTMGSLTVVNYVKSFHDKKQAINYFKKMVKHRKENYRKLYNIKETPNERWDELDNILNYVNDDIPLIMTIQIKKSELY